MKMLLESAFPSERKWRLRRKPEPINLNPEPLVIHIETLILSALSLIGRRENGLI